MKKKSVIGFIIILLIILIIVGFLFYLRIPKVSDENPEWILELIEEKQNTAVENPPTFILKCIYNDKMVYYVSSPCCDQFNYLYDVDKKIICAPDGGLSGNGDGKCSDFNLDQNNCEIIWKDN